MVNSLPVKQSVAQIPYGGETEGRMPLRRVLSSRMRRIVSSLCGIIAKTADFAGGADCAIHLNKGFDTGLRLVTAIHNFMRNGDRVVPALAVNLRACVERIRRNSVTHRRLAIELLGGMLRLRLPAGVAPDVKTLSKQMQELGYNVATNRYWRGTPMDAVMCAADEFLSDVLPKLCGALWNPFAATVKGDARHHLSQSAG